MLCDVYEVSVIQDERVLETLIVNNTILLKCVMVTDLILYIYIYICMCVCVCIKAQNRVCDTLPTRTNKNKSTFSTPTPEVLKFFGLRNPLTLKK